MKVSYDKKFLKELADLPKQQREVIEYFAFKLLKSINSINEIKNLKKLQGHKTAYRVRFGDYRLGFTFENQIVVLERVLHRSHFYRKFPGRF